MGRVPPVLVNNYLMFSSYHFADKKALDILTDVEYTPFQGSITDFIIICL
jgi:hypothetical protein